MKALGIVPARGGSKRLPGKNTRFLGDKPLVCHTLDAAVESNCFDKIILSSDDKTILSFASDYENVDGVRRSDDLSRDRSTALEVVLSIVAREEVHKNYDVVGLLLPTAPFRRPEHIRDGFDLLDDSVDGVISLTQYEFPPQLSVYLKRGIIEPVFEPCPLITGNTRSQDQEVIYRPNGAFYIQWIKKFLINKNFWKGKVRGYVMNRIDSVDIDDSTDLAYAQFLLDKQG